MSQFEGKVFLVTGAGSGIGAATAARLASEGGQVVAADINEASLNDVAASIQRAGGLCNAIQFDLADEESIVALIRGAIQWAGRLDAVINVASDVSGTTMAADVEIGAFDPGLWSRVLQVNLIGTGLIIRESISHLVAAGGGSIVNISSAAAWLGEDQRPAYAASKIGLHSTTRHVARAWGAKGIRCNVIAPGMVLTETGSKLMPQEYRDMMLERICLPTLGAPEDIAAAAAFLVSDEARWITGQILSVDGGLTFRE
ncbi:MULTISPECIES: SDR family NAD(P)-dependent oxidoreductase [Sphingobium]|uniref:SDR family NAD(P)-dependent oxidoreductase n=1 Tax=Sphingobium sp. MI1205 TaxID=407020 RepID=UPI00076FF490|nr:SDR family NAD(P)-dependent oxidoreductase [Sphingobium sp. MI1205]AMK19570.1 short-chain dehydrogenase/reductase SDR [Sphingobium sp. MI1205]